MAVSGADLVVHLAVGLGGRGRPLPRHCPLSQAPSTVAATASSCDPVGVAERLSEELRLTGGVAVPDDTGGVAAPDDIKLAFIAAAGLAASSPAFTAAANVVERLKEADVDARKTVVGAADERRTVDGAADTAGAAGRTTAADEAGALMAVVGSACVGRVGRVAGMLGR